MLRFICSAVLVGIVALLLVLYYFGKSFWRQCLPGEPPVVRGHFFWGNAVEFSQQAVSFLFRSRDQYGEVFTIRLFNQHLTVVMDPHSYEEVSKERAFDFQPIQRQVNWNVFNFVLRDPKRMIAQTSKTIRNVHLRRTLESFDANLRAACSMVPDQWRTEGLREFAAKTLFEAQFTTIFGHPGPTEQGAGTTESEKQGDLFDSWSFFKNFELFHKYFNYLWLGAPRCCFPIAARALRGLLCQPSSGELLARQDASDYIKSAIDYMVKQGQTEADIMGHNLVYLHVNYNTFRLAFWALYYLLERSEAKRAVVEEIEEALRSRLVDNKDDGIQDGGENNVARFYYKDVEQMKMLDSFVQETIRLSSGVFMVRYISKDTTFTCTSTGRQYLMREGDRVAMYPPAIHHDPEIFEDPLTFKHDRFVDAKFYKGGREVPNPVNAFGSICPGKRYALLQLKWFLLTILTGFEFQLVTGERATFDHQYHGHEILPPVKDVQIKLRRRTRHFVGELSPPRLELVDDIY